MVFVYLHLGNFDGSMLVNIPYKHVGYMCSGFLFATVIFVYVLYILFGLMFAELKSDKISCRLAYEALFVPSTPGHVLCRAVMT